MKHLTPQQIEQVKTITWKQYYAKTYGNRKKIGKLTTEQYRTIVEKKFARHIGDIVLSDGKIIHPKKAMQRTPIQEVRDLLHRAPFYQGTNYHKILIVGHTHIYLASPVFEHQDYNKTRMFPITSETLRLMYIFNALVSKQQFSFIKKKITHMAVLTEY